MSKPERPEILNGEHGHIYDLIQYSLERSDAISTQILDLHKLITKAALGILLVVVGSLAGVFFGLVKVLGD